MQRIYINWTSTHTHDGLRHTVESKPCFFCKYGTKDLLESKCKKYMDKNKCMLFRHSKDKKISL